MFQFVCRVEKSHTKQRKTLRMSGWAHFPVQNEIYELEMDKLEWCSRTKERMIGM